MSISNIDKILAKVESLLNETNYEPFTEEVFGRIQTLKELKSYIDSLQEDTPPLTQVNSTPSQTEGGRGVCSQQEEFSIVIVLNGQRHRQVLHKGCFSKKECKEKCSLYGRCQRCCVDLCMIFFHDPHCHFVEEPVSEDLGNYINELSKQFPEVSFAKLSRIAVRVSNWQKKQDQKTIELAEDHAMFAGMVKGKEEAITKACKYLQEHREEVETEDNGISGWISDEFIEKFKKAMKDE